MPSISSSRTAFASPSLISERSAERPSATRRAGGRACSGSGGPPLATRARRRSVRARRARSRPRGRPRGTRRSSSRHPALELVTSGSDGENGLPFARAHELDSFGLMHGLPPSDTSSEQARGPWPWCWGGRRLQDEPVVFDLPGTRDPAPDRIVLGPGVGQAAARARADDDAPVARRRRASIPAT